MNKYIKKKLNRAAIYWPTLCRVLLFCMLCAIVLATSSGLFANVDARWSQVIPVLIAAIFSLLLTKLFARWEKLEMKEIGFAHSSNRFPGFFIV